ncbi:MogA/MoaB family molybdenum cofactor biosynthesis protein [Microbacterium sp. SSW1-59]|uniref:MogA/MoaB family molybdenum cofactor biosynthesis protein n=1 Tax=Microbacterium xanthum TaxID=3079794 RepID=UPI002AD59C65|nr:MogA/MoaB family molybdenum cofactor biosynthesis protein [Microbacterium sp. SSW1-59]MDZ8200062.1 MogA/MoaB family molybdenum cofactor biosynthesis protein [Microbacterium sp. SSW1-59]
MTALAAAVVTVSDRSYRGVRADTAGPVAVAVLRDAGYRCDDASLIPDGTEAVASELRRLVEAGARVIVTCGGTGVSPRDLTPEGTARVIEREIPGVAERLRADGAAHTPLAALSRGRAGVTGGTFIVNLPGSPRAVASGMPFVVDVASHILSQVEGGDH